MAPRSPAVRVPSGGGGAFYPPPVISGTEGRSETPKVTIENSQRDVSNKHSLFATDSRTVNSNGLKISINTPKFVFFSKKNLGFIVITKIKFKSLRVKTSKFWKTEIAILQNHLASCVLQIL